MATIHDGYILPPVLEAVCLRTVVGKHKWKGDIADVLCVGFLKAAGCPTQCWTRWTPGLIQNGSCMFTC